MTKRLLRKEKLLRKRLAEKGLVYDFPGFVSLALFHWVFFAKCVSKVVLNTRKSCVLCGAGESWSSRQTYLCYGLCRST